MSIIVTTKNGEQLDWNAIFPKNGVARGTVLQRADTLQTGYDSPSTFVNLAICVDRYNNPDEPETVVVVVRTFVTERFSVLPFAKKGDSVWLEYEWNEKTKTPVMMKFGKDWERSVVSEARFLELKP